MFLSFKFRTFQRRTSIQAIIPNTLPRDVMHVYSNLSHAFQFFNVCPESWQEVLSEHEARLLLSVARSKIHFFYNVFNFTVTHSQKSTTRRGEGTGKGRL